MTSGTPSMRSTLPSARRRATYVRVLLLTIALGLASRRFGAMLPTLVARYAGDVLWATMVFWLLSITIPSTTRTRLASAALAAAMAVEFSQLIRAPWLDALRPTSFGALVLGQGFLWSDLLCYAVGVALAVVIDRLLWPARAPMSGK